MEQPALYKWSKRTILGAGFKQQMGDLTTLIKVDIKIAPMLGGRLGQIKSQVFSMQFLVL